MTPENEAKVKDMQLRHLRQDKAMLQGCLDIANERIERLEAENAALKLAAKRAGEQNGVQLKSLPADAPVAVGNSAVYRSDSGDDIDVEFARYMFAEGANWREGCEDDLFFSKADISKAIDAWKAKQAKPPLQE